jgi:hypothetical protein
VFVSHEEEINQFLGMSFYGGVFMEEEVSVRALHHETVAPYLV